MRSNKLTLLHLELTISTSIVHDLSLNHQLTTCNFRSIIYLILFNHYRIKSPCSLRTSWKTEHRDDLTMCNQQTQIGQVFLYTLYLIYTTHYTLYIIYTTHYTLYIIYNTHYTLYIIYNTHHTLYIIYNTHYTLYIIYITHYTLYIIYITHYTLYIIYNTHYTLYIYI